MLLHRYVLNTSREMSTILLSSDLFYWDEVCRFKMIFCAKISRVSSIEFWPQSCASIWYAAFDSLYTVSWTSRASSYSSVFAKELPRSINLESVRIWFLKLQEKDRRLDSNSGSTCLAFCCYCLIWFVILQTCNIL